MFGGGGSDGVFAAAAWGLRVEGREELAALIKRKLKRGG